MHIPTDLTAVFNGVRTGQLVLRRLRASELALIE